MKKILYIFLGLSLMFACSDDGDTGNDNIAIGQPYQGGIIFYINPNGVQGYIAATEDYNGKLNWDDAVSYCDALTVGEYNDWHLPRKYELNYLYDQRDVIGGFSDSPYWSSSFINNRGSWYQHFQNGTQGQAGFGSSFSVRPVRSFSF